MGSGTDVRRACALDGSGRRVAIALSGGRLRLLADDDPLANRGPVRGLFTGEGLYLKTVIIPPMPGDEARATLSLTERATIPFPPERARMAVVPGPAAIGGLVWLVAVADTARIDPLRKTVARGPVTCVPSALTALRRHGARFDDGTAHLFVHADERASGVHVIGDGGVLFTRESGWSAPPPHSERVAEIVRAVRAWRRSGDLPLKGWIVGVGGNDRNLRDDLAEALGFALTPYDPLSDFVDGVGDGVALAPLVGAALTGPDDIDLVPTWRDTLRRMAPRKRWPVAVAAGIVALSPVAYEAVRQIGALQEDRSALQEEVTRLEGAKARFDAATLRLNAARKVIAASRDAGAPPGARIRWRLLYDTVAQAIPPSVALTGFTVAAGDEGPLTVTLQGTARGAERHRNDALWRLVGRLEESIFEGKGRVTLALERPDQADSPLGFTIEGTLHAAAAPFLAMRTEGAPCSPA